MIRHSVSLENLAGRIQALNSTWLARARQHSRELRRLGRFEESTHIWGEVKPVFIEIQFGKCIYCERQFEDPILGTIEYDLEHFRPKSPVKYWPDSNLHDVTYTFETGGAYPSGYYWLAYEIQNYAASCKVCNTPLKSNYFPVAALRAPELADGEQLRAEVPFLCYPIGDVDDDPETLVSFLGTTAIPASTQPAQRKRGQVIIDFFQLNDRENLHQQRAQMIILVGNSLTLIDAGLAGENEQGVVDYCTSARAPHAACSRAFKRMWEQDRNSALKVLEACKGFIASLLVSV